MMKSKANAAVRKTGIRDILLKINYSYVLKGLLYCAASYFAGSAQLLFETYPLGTALLCTLRENILFSAAGAVISSFTTGKPAIIQLSGIFISLGFRYALYAVLHKGKFSVDSLKDSVGARVASALAGGITVSLIRIIYGGFVYYDLLAAVAFLLISAGAVYVYSMCLDRENLYTQKYEAGLAALMFSAVLALRSVSVLGMSVGGAAAFFITLYAAGHGGALRGVVVGFMCGAALDLTLCPMFGIIGFICGVLSSLEAYIGVLSSVVIGICCGMYISGFEVLTMYLPEAVLSVCIYLPLQYLKVLPGLRLLTDEVKPQETVNTALLADTAGLNALEKRLAEIADTYESLSVILESVSKRERSPASDELTVLCAREFGKYCGKCKNRFQCYSGGKPTSRDFSRLGKLLYEKQAVEEGDIPEKMTSLCSDIGQITAKINISYAELLKTRAQRDKIGVISADYSLSAKLLSDCSAMCLGEYRINGELTRQIRRKTRYTNLFGREITVCGEGKKLNVTASGIDAGKIRLSASDIRRNFETILSVPLTEPEITIESGATVLNFKSRNRYSCDCHAASKTRNGEIINGDTAFTVMYGSLVYGAVFDGMGSGRDASLSSKLAGITAQKLLGCGCSPDDGLQILNHVTSMRCSECFTTVDMLCFDRITGAASFYKCGAAPSLVLRGGRVFSIASHTPPVGIMPKLYAEKIDFELKHGDFAVLLSDGISEADAELNWLYELLADTENNTPKGLAEEIVEYAYNKFGCKDDMTAAVFKITVAE